MNHSKGNNLMTHSTFAVLSNCHLCLFPACGSAFQPHHAPGNHHSVFCLYGFTYSAYFIKIEYMLFRVCLPSLSMMFPRSIHVISTSFLFWLNNSPLYVYISRFLYLVIGCCTSWLFPHLGYHK